MIEETPTVSNLFGDMTTDQGDMTDTTGENGVTSSASDDEGSFYFESLVVAIGVIGIAANGLVLYAMVASKQHKKQELIVNHNALDFYSSVFLVITYGSKLSNIHLSGTLGHWLCLTLLSDCLLFCGISASWINLTAIAIERYLKVVHPVWSRNKLRKWMTYSAIAFAWITGFVYEMINGFAASAVIDGVCYGYVMMSPEAQLAVAVCYVSFTYVLVLVVSTFCYGKILLVIRRQARVMAGNNPGGSVDRQATVTVDQTATITVDQQATILVDRQATIPVDRTPLRPSQIRFRPT